MRSLVQKTRLKATLLTTLIILMGLSVSFAAPMSGADGRTTGTEEFTIQVLSNHYADGDTLSFTATANNLDPASDYEVEWFICRSFEDTYWENEASNGGTYTPPDGTSFDGYSCEQAWMEWDSYDAESDDYAWNSDSFQGIETIPAGVSFYTMSLSVDTAIETDIPPWDLDEMYGGFECGNGDFISWYFINDGYDDCGDATDENYNWDDWPTMLRSMLWNLEQGYFLVAELQVNGYEVVDHHSASFAYGQRGDFGFQSPHPETILAGMDYEFAWEACNIYRFILDPIDYDLDYEIIDISDGMSVSSGTHSLIDGLAIWDGCSGWETILISGLAIGNYSLTITMFQAGVDLGNALNQEFTVIDATLSGTEELGAVADSNHFASGADLTFSIDVSGLEPSTDYEVEWYLCENFEDMYWNGMDDMTGTYIGANGATFDDYGCERSYSTANSYDPQTGLNEWVEQSFQGIESISSGVVAETISLTVSTTHETYIYPWDLDEMYGGFECGNGDFISWHAINDGDDDCGDATDENYNWDDWPMQSYDLLWNKDRGYFLMATLQVSGYEVVDHYSDSIAYGERGWIGFDATHWDGILEGMDYEFGFDVCNMFHFIVDPIDYDLDYWLTDSAGAIIDSGTHSQIDDRELWNGCSDMEAVILNGLAVDVYNLNMQLIMQGQIIDEFDIEFEVSDPNEIDDEAYLMVMADTDADGIGYASFTVEDMADGQYYDVVWSVSKAGNPPAEEGTYTLIAPPSSDISGVAFPALSDGQYCIDAKLMIDDWEQDSDSDCFSQASTVDSDGDGLRDIDDACPDEDSTGADSDSDGCIDLTDTDGDGWDDNVESACGSDPAEEASVPTDTNSDGECDSLDDDDDGDGATDVEEAAAGTDPLDDTDTPVAVNNPPTCALYYSIESDGIVVANDNIVVAAVSPGTATNPTSLSVTLPAGNYYLIAKCSDPDGDLVTATIDSGSGPITVGPLSEVTAGALVMISEGTSDSVDVSVTYNDGVNYLAAQVTIDLEGDSSGGLLPGFSAMFGALALLGAALILRRRT